MSRVTTCAWALSVLVVLVGCGNNPNPHSPDPAETNSTPTPTAVAPDATTPPPLAVPSVDTSGLPTAPIGRVDEHTGETIAPIKVPVWDQKSRESVVDAAEHAMEIYAQPDLSQDEWFTQMEPLMTQKAALDYSYLEPSSLPVKKVTGKGKLVNETSAYIGRVEVPTDNGTYTVLLNRSSADADWKVHRFTPPENQR